jgi:spore germination protein GerM
MRRLVVAAAAAVVALGATACGVGGDSQLQTIDQEDLLGLDETTTTSTTSTTTPTSSSVPTVESTVAGTSTTIASESVSLYFVDGARLQPVTISLAGTATPSRVIQALLTSRPSGQLGIGLRTLLPPGLVNDVDAPGTGEVTVDLVGEAFNRIDPADQRTAIGQIVMTLVFRPGIGQVRFTLDGAPLRVPRGDGLQSEPGGAVSFNDYESLLDVTEVAVTTTETTPATRPVTTPPPTGPPSATPPSSAP